MYYLQLLFYPLRFGESVPGSDMNQHLAVGHPLEGKATKSDHLIEQNSIAPNI